jgi:RNA polymerase sigma-70 factor (ECF subfamily)
MASKPVSSSEPSSISSTLLGQLRARRPEAWERLVRLYGPLIYRWCRRAGVPAEDAADLLQEVFAAVLLHLPDFRRATPRDSFTGWLATITRNKIRDHYRRRQRRPQARGGTTAQLAWAAIPQEGEFSAESVQADADSSALLAQRALELIQAEFEPRTWQVFLKTAVEGQAPAHVAEDLGMSAPAVYTAKSRVLRRLRQVLAELEES